MDKTPAGATDTLLLQVESVLHGPVAEPPPSTDRVVVIPFECPHCHAPLEVECTHSPGFGLMAFYPFDCPKCGKDNHRQLPGDIVDVRVAAEEADE